MARQNVGIMFIRASFIREENLRPVLCSVVEGRVAAFDHVVDPA